MALTNAAPKYSDAIAPRAIPRAADSDAATATYGGLVGQMIDEIDARLGKFAPVAAIEESPEDVFHTISIVGGYVGLAAGFGVAAAIIARFF
ncbi:hypothetical protein BH11PSE5_BH11PSE5_10790 [soil metagenome]